MKGKNILSQEDFLRAMFTSWWKAKLKKESEGAEVILTISYVRSCAYNLLKRHTLPRDRACAPCHNFHRIPLHHTFFAHSCSPAPPAHSITRFSHPRTPHHFPALPFPHAPPYPQAPLALLPSYFFLLPSPRKLSLIMNPFQTLVFIDLDSWINFVRFTKSYYSYKPKPLEYFLRPSA